VRQKIINHFLQSSHVLALVLTLTAIHVYP
jgi:hypothetical protein